MALARGLQLRLQRHWENSMTHDKELLRGIVARGYCHDKNRHKELDGDLLEAIVEELLLAASAEPPAAQPEASAESEEPWTACAELLDSQGRWICLLRKGHTGEHSAKSSYFRAKAGSSTQPTESQR